MSVGPKTALIPEPVPGDPDPHSAEELAAALGPLRSIGTRVIDLDLADTKAADLINRMVNRLPQSGRVDQDERDALLGQVHGGREMSPALEQVKAATGFCSREVYLANQPTMRGCLSSKRDQWLTLKTQEYWAQAAGS